MFGWACVCLFVSRCLSFSLCVVQVQLNFSLLNLVSFVTFCAKLFVCLFAFAFRCCVISFFALSRHNSLLLLVDLPAVFDIYIRHTAVSFHVILCEVFLSRLFCLANSFFLCTFIALVRFFLCSFVCECKFLVHSLSKWFDTFEISSFLCGKLFHFWLCWTN